MGSKIFAQAGPKPSRSMSVDNAQRLGARRKGLIDCAVDFGDRVLDCLADDVHFSRRGGGLRRAEGNLAGTLPGGVPGGLSGRILGGRTGRDEVREGNPEPLSVGEDPGAGSLDLLDLGRRGPAAEPDGIAGPERTRFFGSL